MSESTAPVDLPLNRDERKRLLVVACVADRLAWCQACEPRPRPPLHQAGYILQLLEPLTALLPGRIGRWLRGANFIAKVSRQVSGMFA